MCVAKHLLLFLFLLSPAIAQDKGLQETTTPISSWRFKESLFTGGTIPDTSGDLDIRLTKGGLAFINEDAQEAVLLPNGARRILLAENIDPSTLLPGEAFTISTWLRMDTPGKWAGVFSAIQDNGEHERGWAAGVHDRKFYFGLRTRGGEKITYLFSQSPAEERQWHHLLASYDGATMRLYVDGVLEAESREQSGDIFWPEATNISIGAYEDNDERHPLLGALHSIELYDTALPADDVARIHARLAGTFPEPQTPEDQINARTPDTLVGWPMYRRDPQRSARTPESLALPLTESWREDGPTPRPSWPEPAQRSYWQNLQDIVPRVVFDLADHPVSDGTLVVIGSSRDDHLRCLELDTGQMRWMVATEGPIRFAPVIDGDGVIVASDDGFLRRIDLTTGAVEWATRLAPSDRRIPGNGRVISNWPIRTGPVLDRGLIHATSGLFPKFGTFAHAVDPGTGDIVWQRPLPGVSPQGYLLASPTRLFVPTGRTSPVMLGRGDGRSLGTFELPGGTFALLVEDELISGPGSSGEIAPANISTRETAAGFRADRGVVVPEFIILQRGDLLRVLDRPTLLALRKARNDLLQEQARLEAELRNNANASETALAQVRNALEENLNDIQHCELWQTTINGHSLALASEQLIVGSDDAVVIFDARTGERLWSHKINGLGVGLAVAGGRLLVTTDQGTLHAFGPEAMGSPPQQIAQPEFGKIQSVLLADELAMIKHSGMDRKSVV